MKPVAAKVLLAGIVVAAGLRDGAAQGLRAGSSDF